MGLGHHLRTGSHLPALRNLLWSPPDPWEKINSSSVTPASEKHDFGNIFARIINRSTPNLFYLWPVQAEPPQM